MGNLQPVTRRMFYISKKIWSIYDGISRWATWIFLRQALGKFNGNDVICQNLVCSWNAQICEHWTFRVIKRSFYWRTKIGLNTFHLHRWHFKKITNIDRIVKVRIGSSLLWTYWLAPRSAGDSDHTHWHFSRQYEPLYVN